MTTGQASPEELAEDLVLAMRHLEPLLTAMLALLQNSDRAVEGQIEALSAVMERIATGLETTTEHLQAIGPRLQAQEAGLNGLSSQVRALGQRLDYQERGRDKLQGRMEEFLDLLRD
ncbi:hypothetical protein [Paracoccus chinensis]|uniref:Uncharacterized protein n=1 Tax=Paracoccus chinensis TaxID=525640 RepID=A0A1G9MQ01_9RHOB|nr:hypothetical protein [Paracoccus chinensis]SDL75725.1 hypothetical protein SAMN04487971_12222 [Paracoccus chinensis]